MSASSRFARAAIDRMPTSHNFVPLPKDTNFETKPSSPFARAAIDRMPATHNDVRQGPSHGHRDRDEEHLVPGRLAARQDLLRGRRSVGAGFGTVPLVKQDPGQRGGDDASNVAEHVACVTAKQTPHRA